VIEPLLNWLDETTGWRKLKATLLDRKIPKGVNWSNTLGSLLLFCFGVQAITGMLLAMHYSASPDHAYQSVQYLGSQVPMGAFLRGLHHWTASAMVVLAVLHLMRVFFSGAFKYPRQMTWFTGVALLLVVIGLGFTGYLLPWDQKAYWATTVGSKIASITPVIGPWVGKILKGGDTLGAVTLARFYSIHVLVLPALFVSLVLVHLFLIVWHGIAAPPERMKQEPSGDWKAGVDRRYHDLKEKGVPFFPDIVFKDMMAVLLLFAVLAALAYFKGAGLEDMADPTATDYNPRPEWYFLFLFQFLKYIPGKLEAVATSVLPGLAITVLFLLPFLDRGARRHPLDRKSWTGLGLAALGGVVFLTVQGLRSPDVNVEIPKNPEVVQGKRLFAELRCASCHSIDGKGGVVGPTLDNAGSRRGKDWIEEHFRNPQAMTPGSKMPNFKLLDTEVEALTAYILSLEGGAYSADAPKLFEDQCMSCHMINGKGDDSGPDLSLEGKTREQGWIEIYIREPEKIYPDSAMPGYAKDLTQPQIEDLARYLAAQRGTKGSVTRVAGAKPAKAAKKGKAALGPKGEGSD
jgi:ubiquinol-cytochrome c reductase cytochrome b subunit